MRADDDSFHHREDDTNWPKKNIVGKQELEIRVGNDHIAFEVCPLPQYPLCVPLHCFFSQTAKIGSLVDIQDSEDPEGLRVFYYLVQDLKVTAGNELKSSFSPPSLQCLIFSLISLHFKIKPI